MTDTNKRSATLALGAVAALVACGAAVFGMLLWSSPPPLQPVPAVTIAVPQVLNTAPMFVAVGQGLFQKAGVKVNNSCTPGLGFSRYPI